jgi:hypothetical protein
MTSSILSGRLVSSSGNYKVYMSGGAAVLLVGVFLLGGIGPETTLMGLSWRMVVVGLGLGPSQSLVNLIVQAAFPMSQIGVATSSTQFFRQIGNTVGVAIFGTLLTLNLTAELPKQVPMMASLAGGGFDMSQAQTSVMSPGALRSRIEGSFDEMLVTLERGYAGDPAAIASVRDNPLLPAQLKEQMPATPEAALPAAEIAQRMATIRTMMASGLEQAVTSIETGIRLAFSNAITGMFSTSLWIILIGFVMSLFIPVISLQREMPKAAAKAASAESLQG